MKEWNDWANSFNSMKGLLYSEQYKAIDEWKLGKRGAPLPPVEVSLDPIHACNLMCTHCNAHRYLSHSSLPNEHRMPDEHMLNLVQFLADWGVKGICWGGGGEPTLHSKLKDGLLLAHKLGVENSIATNGTLFTDELIDVATRTCRWIGVSVDAACKKTYKIGRNQDLFTKTIINLGKLAVYAKNNNLHCDVAFKFLIFDYNQTEIFKACKLAKSLGIKDFHARPADFRHQGLGEWQKKLSGYNIPLIKKQFEKCHALADDNFHVYTVVHKFNEDFTPKRRFTQCFATPICIQLCADGNVYLCPDTRHMEDYKLGEHYPNPKSILDIWGNKKHYDLVFATGCQPCLSRCTFSPYNEQVERLFINKDDPFCRNFV
jgi:MoaA/NifB/PqqE/SkfB family radical SAM enzyme